jgi:hypothetical protein
MPAHTLLRNARSHPDIWLGTIDHPPYNPDLAPSDFHMFLHLKTFPGIRRFHGDNEVEEAVNTWFALQAASFYDAGIQTLAARYESVSTMVETMSKSSVKYVYQMTI